MKKTKFLTCLAALTLLLASCEVTAKDLGSDTTDTESSDTTTSDTGTGGDTGESGDTGDTGTGEGGDTGTGGDGSGGDGSGDGGDGGDTGGPTITYTYSLEVENGDSLTLNYDEALETQQGVELSIKLVTTSSTGDVTKEDATADNLTFTVSDPTIVTISGLTVLPLSGGETSITVKWSEHEDATTSVGVTVTDVTVYGPTTWDEYITNEYDRGVIADFLGSVGVLDELLPFYLGDTNPTVTTGNSVSGQRLIITYNTATSTTLSTWVSLLEADGWEQTGHETSYNEVYTFTKDGYTVEVNLEYGSLYLYLYPPEPEPEPASTWNEYITNENYRAAIAEIFGSVEALDEFLPFYSDTEPTSIVTGTHYSKGARLVIQYNSDVLSAWVSLFEADGWTQTDHAVSYNETYTFEKDGYTVDLELEYGVTYVYAYPKAEEEEDTGLETAQAILNAAAAQTNGFQDFEYVNVQARYSNGGGGAYEHYNFDLTTDNSNLFGREIRHDEDGDDETKFRTRYYYEKYYYDINNTAGANTHSGPSSNSYNGVNRVLGWRLTSSRNYDAAFDNASSIDLAGATDFELVTEDNGNYKLTFIYNNTWYCYKATADCKLVGAGSAINWTSSSSYEIYYGEEESEETFNALMEPFFDDEYWFPKESSEEEIASDILKAVQGTTPNWTAFYADVTKDDDDAYTEYLTTDGDGNLYGYRYDWDDWEEEGSEFWYYGGYKCMYSYDGSQAQTPGEVYTTFEDELEALTYSLTISFNLASDPYTLTEVDGGYELTVAKSTTYYNTYTFTVDASYNLLAIDTDAQIGSQSDEIALGHVEGITYADVEAFIATTNFNPADFGFGEGGDDPSNPGSGSSTVVDSDDIEDALSLLLEYGADTSSWSGVAFQDVIDYSENMYGFLDIDLEKFDETILATENDGVVTGLDEDLVYLYGELYADYSEYEYYDGTTLHSLDYGSYSSEETSLDLSYFTSYPLSQVQYDIAYLTQFSGLTTLYSYLGYEFDGGIKVSDDAITVTASVGAAQEYEDEDYGDCQETLTITLEVVYDLDGGLISSSFSYIDYIYYPSIYSSLTYSQTTTCSNFTGTIDTPTWVVKG